MNSLSSPSADDATERRISVFAFVMLSLFLVSALLFLVFTFVRQGQDFNLARTYVVGQPLSPLSSEVNLTGTYAEGRVLFHRTHPFIEWDIVHSGVGTVVSLDIFGPIDPAQPTEGPVKAVLCRTGSSFPCLFQGPNRIRQRIQTTPGLRPLLNDVAHILDDLHLYKLRLNTTAYPEGAFFFRFS